MRIGFGHKPMKCDHVRRILTNLGFTKDKGKSTGHEQWRCYRDNALYKVTLSCHKGEVKAKDVKSMISQAGVSKKTWYAALNKKDAALLNLAPADAGDER